MTPNISITKRILNIAFTNKTIRPNSWYERLIANNEFSRHCNNKTYVYIKIKSRVGVNKLKCNDGFVCYRTGNTIRIVIYFTYFVQENCTNSGHARKYMSLI